MFVKQTDGLKDASDQSFNQVHPLKNFLAEKLIISNGESAENHKFNLAIQMG